MEVTIDKFGRILIPKKIRKLLNLQPGQTLELNADARNKSIDLAPKEQIEARLAFTDSGIPTFHFPPQAELDFDVVEMLRRSREERDERLLGL